MASLGVRLFCPFRGDLTDSKVPVSFPLNPTLSSGQHNALFLIHEFWTAAYSSVLEVEFYWRVSTMKPSISSSDLLPLVRQQTELQFALHYIRREVHRSVVHTWSCEPHGIILCAGNFPHSMPTDTDKLAKQMELLLQGYANPKQVNRTDCYVSHKLFWNTICALSRCFYLPRKMATELALYVKSRLHLALEDCHTVVSLSLALKTTLLIWCGQVALQYWTFRTLKKANWTNGRTWGLQILLELHQPDISINYPYTAPISIWWGVSPEHLIFVLAQMKSRDFAVVCVLPTFGRKPHFLRSTRHSGLFALASLHTNEKREHATFFLRKPRNNCMSSTIFNATNWSTLIVHKIQSGQTKLFIRVVTRIHLNSSAGTRIDCFFDHH